MNVFFYFFFKKAQFCFITTESNIDSLHLLLKSVVLLSANASTADYEHVCLILGVQKMDDKSKNLGFPSFWGRSKRKALNFIFQRILSKIREWKQVFLSQAGKEVLIKAVVQVIPSFAMSSFSFFLITFAIVLTV